METGQISDTIELRGYLACPAFHIEVSYDLIHQFHALFGLGFGHVDCFVQRTTMARFE